MTRSTFDTHRRRLLTGAGAALPAWGQAPAWPTRPVKLVVPFGPGGSTDVVGRLLGQRLSERGGPSGDRRKPRRCRRQPRRRYGGHATRNGDALLFASGSITISPNVNACRPFDTHRDLLPISNVAGCPMRVVVQDKSPYRSLKELIAAAKAAPGALSFGSADVGRRDGHRRL